MKILYNYIKHLTLDSIDNYLIMLSILHNDMHNENFIFSYYNLQNNFLDSIIIFLFQILIINQELKIIL